MISDDNLQPIPTYPLLGRLFFWLFWLMGLLVCLLFSLFVLITIRGRGMGGLLTVWNLLVAGGEIYLLNQAKQALSQREKPMSELLWRAALAGVGVPMLAATGCGMLSGFMPRMAG